MLVFGTEWPLHRACLQHWVHTQIQCSDNLISAAHEVFGSEEASGSRISQLSRAKLCLSYKCVSSIRQTPAHHQLSCFWPLFRK